MNLATAPRGIFGTTKKNVPAVILRAYAMYNGISGNPSMFTTLPMTMAAFLVLITALVLTQQTATETKATGTAKLRNVKRDLLWTAMEALRVYIQGLADQASSENGAALIQCGGLLLAGVPTHQKAPLTATLTTENGVVHLAANVLLLVGKKAARNRKHQFNWQWSADGKVWNDAKSTPYATTVITGLTAMTTYSFRVSVTVGTVTGAWSQAVSILVLH
jgi:hypothetical protein